MQKVDADAHNTEEWMGMGEINGTHGWSVSTGGLPWWEMGSDFHCNDENEWNFARLYFVFLGSCHLDVAEAHRIYFVLTRYWLPQATLQRSGFNILIAGGSLNHCSTDSPTDLGPPHDDGCCGQYSFDSQIRSPWRKTSFSNECKVAEQPVIRRVDRVREFREVGFFGLFFKVSERNEIWVRPLAATVNPIFNCLVTSKLQTEIYEHPSDPTRYITKLQPGHVWNFILPKRWILKSSVLVKIVIWSKPPEHRDRLSSLPPKQQNFAGTHTKRDWRSLDAYLAFQKQSVHEHCNWRW
jgi:hypothetical protein